MNGWDFLEIIGFSRLLPGTPRPLSVEMEPLRFHRTETHWLLGFFVFMLGVGAWGKRIN